jgi:hypothetical protein
MCPENIHAKCQRRQQVLRILPAKLFVEAFHQILETDCKEQHCTSRARKSEGSQKFQL